MRSGAQKPNTHLIRGIAVHNAIRQFYKHGLNRCSNFDYGDLRKLVIQLLKDEWINQEKDLSELGLTEDEAVFYFHDSLKMMLNFLDDFIKDYGFEKPSPTIEKTLFSKKYMLLGRIDAIHSTRSPPLLVDFKTCKSKEIIDDYKRQMCLYALLYYDYFKIIPHVGIHFLKFQNGLTRFRINKRYLEKTRSLVLDIHDRTQSGDLKDYPCICGWCDRNYRVSNEANS
jgi:hypothetical protein